VATDGWTNSERGFKILSNTGGGSSVRWKIGSPATTGGEPGGNIGTDFGIERFNDSGSSLGLPLFIQRGNGNVGIGTMNPGELLSVNNGAVGTYYDRVNYGIRGIFQHSGNSSGILSAGGLQIAAQGTNNAVNGSGDINFFVTNSNTGGASTDGGYIQAMKIKYN